MMQEAIASTEIETGPMDRLTREALLLFTTYGDISFSTAMEIARKVLDYDKKTRPLDNYLNGRTIEECIMGAAQKVIDNFETTYDKKRYGDEPTGRWVQLNHAYVYKNY